MHIFTQEADTVLVRKVKKKLKAAKVLLLASVSAKIIYSFFFFYVHHVSGVSLMLRSKVTCLILLYSTYVARSPKPTAAAEQEDILL